MNYNETIGILLNNIQEQNEIIDDNIPILKIILLICYYQLIDYQESINELLINVIKNNISINNNINFNMEDFLNCILNKLIIDNQIDLEDLQLILQICYYSLIDDTIYSNKVLNSLLITVLKRFIDIENYRTIYIPWKQTQWNEQDIPNYLTMLVNSNIKKIINEEL